jgi:hypothetical protein
LLKPIWPNIGPAPIRAGLPEPTQAHCVSLYFPRLTDFFNTGHQALKPAHQLAGFMVK